MGRLDDLKRLKEAAAAKLADENRISLAAAAAAAVAGASSVVDAAESVAERSGLTKKNGDLSKIKVVRAALRPTTTAKSLLRASSEELEARRRTQHGEG